MIGFLLGMIAGSMIGVTVMCCLIASKEDD